MIGNPYKGKSFKGLIQYLFHGRKDDPNPHRVEWHVVRNMPIDEPRALPMLLRAAAAQNLRVEKPVYHLPISWPPEERLDKATQVAIAEQLLADIGLAEHQCVIVAHNDGDCSHIHLVINTVHPETGKVWNAWRDVYRIMESLERQERERGLRIVSRPDLAEWKSGKRDPERKREATRGELLRAEREGDTPLAPWSEREMRDVRTAVTRHFREAKSWNDLEQRLAQHGLQLRRAGQGFRLTDGSKFMTLSKIGKQARWQLLEERFERTWDEHEATRSLVAYKRRELEPPDALAVMRGEAERGAGAQAQRDQKVRQFIDAWRAHSDYESFRERERAVTEDGRKLLLLRRQLRRNEWQAHQLDKELTAARSDYATLLDRIYRNPVKARDRIQQEVRGLKDWQEIELRKMGRLRWDLSLALTKKTRVQADRLLARVKPLYTRVWRLEVRLETLQSTAQTLHGKIAMRERSYDVGRVQFGSHEKRQQERLDLFRKRARALKPVDVQEIMRSDLHAESKKALAAVVAQERVQEQQRRDRRRSWERER